MKEQINAAPLPKEINESFKVIAEWLEKNYTPDTKVVISQDDFQITEIIKCQPRGITE